MNLKNLFKLSALMFVFLFVLSSFSYGQTTYYVDVVNGLDGYNGLSATVTGTPGVGPKQTINNAIAAASAGDYIVVAYANGNLYNETVVVTKKLYFRSTGGAPNVFGFTVNNTALPASGNHVEIFDSGAFKFTTTLTLTAGVIQGGSNITVAGTVTRTAGSVDSQLNYSGGVAFVYNGGAAITTGFDMPAAGDITSLASFTVNVAGTNVTLNSDKYVVGNVNTTGGGTLNLGTYTLTLKGTAQNFSGGNVTNGTLSFIGGAAVAQTGAVNLPTISISGTNTVVTFAASTTIGNITVTGTGAGATVGAATTVGNVTHGGTGAVTLTSPTTIGDVSNTSSGTVGIAAGTTIKSISNSGSGSVAVTTVAAYAVTNNVNQSGTGFINFNGGAPTIGGNVTNNPTLALAAAGGAVTNKGYIAFTPDVAVVITGVLTVNATIGGTTHATAADAYTASGDVRFLGTTADVTITGGVVISSSHTLAKGAAAGPSFTGLGGVNFASTSGDILIPGGINISTNWPAVTGITTGNNGSLIAVARIAAGAFGLVANRIGAIQNTSVATNGGTDGSLLTVCAANVGIFGTSITTSGAGGGIVSFGNESINFSGNITNARTTALATGHIVFGTAATAGVGVTVGGNIDNQGASSIIFNSFNGAAAENFVVTGSVKSTGTGSISVLLGALTGTGTFSFGSVYISAGTINLAGAGAGIMDVLVKGGSFLGGTFNMATTVVPTSTVNPVAIAAGDRLLQLGGLVYQFSTATTATNFMTNTNVVMYIQPTTVLTSQTITGAGMQTVWPGIMVVDNQTGLQPAVTFSGGNFRVLSHLAFNQSEVNLNNMYIFVGGQLAPNVGAGNFYNHSGYTTTGTAFVSMNGNAAALAGGAGTFQSFEVDMAAGVTFAANATFTSTFNLTNGAVTGGAFVIFNNSTVYPTIVVNAGTFAVAPTFTSMVNVYYIGIDKVTGNELPAAANKLNNLTVATSNGAVAGKGTVSVGVATTVNGALNIFPNQALLLNGVDLTLKGATAQIDGVLANVAAGDMLILARPTGTVITGTGNGWLPDVQVAVGSVGNSISGVKGLITTFLGGNNVWGTDDFNTATTQATGSISYDATAGGGAGALTVTFGAGAGAAGAKTQFNNLTTVHANNVFTLGGDAVATGNLAHPAGQVNVATFTLTFLGTTHTMTEGATVIGAGTLNFTPAAAATFTTTGTSLANGPVLDVANFVIDVDNANLQIPAASDDLYVNGNLYVTAPINGANSLDIDTGILYAQGPIVSFDAGTSVITTTGTGILYSDVTTGTQTLMADGAVAIANLTVADNLKLEFTGAGALTVGTAFQHDGGEFNFGPYNITVTGTFNRTAGTYAATTGYLIIDNAVFNQGATAVTIPNLQFGQAASVVGPTFGNAGVVTVSQTLAIDVNAANPVVTKVATVSKLAVANGAAVEFYSGKFDAAPLYGATIDLYLYNGVATVVDATVWPATATLVQKLTVDNGAAATLPGSRQVNTGINYIMGTLNVPTTKVLTVADNSAIDVNAGVLTLTGTGTTAYGNDIVVRYIPSAAAYVSNGNELPSTVKDLSFTRLTNTVNRLTTLAAKPVTVTGTLTIKNNLTTVVGGPITLNGNLIIAKDAGSNATNPITTFGDALNIAGDQNTTITVPATGGTIAALTMTKAGSQNTATLQGGNLTTGLITFVKGLLVTGDNYVQIAQGAVGTPNQGFVRNVATGDLSHVVGNVRTTLKAGIIEAFGRNEFPVGSLLSYCPVAITTLNPGANVTLGVNVIAGFSETAPTGFVGLPIVNGVAVGTDIARYAQFHWSLKTDVNLGNTKFDLELTKPGFDDFDDLNNVRIIRRMGTIVDNTNPWTLQGTQYNNYTSAGTPTVTNVQTYQGLSTAAAIFTYGMKTRLTATPFANVLIGKVGGAYYNPTISLAGHFTAPTGSTLTYTATSTNAAVATALVVNNTVTITAVADGICDVTVRAEDQNHDFITTTIHVTVNGLVGNEKDQNAIPTEFAMSQNYPNPFNPTTAIKFALPKESHVTIKVINIIGQEVANLVDEVRPAGYHVINFNANGLASGTYIAIIKAGEFNKTIKMNLLK